MPFVPLENRGSMTCGNPPRTVGDRCYLEYTKLILAWLKERRWTTAHNEFKRVFDVDDAQATKTLAYLVFLIREVMPYEEKMVIKNGDIPSYRPWYDETMKKMEKENGTIQD